MAAVATKKSTTTSSPPLQRQRQQQQQNNSNKNGSTIDNNNNSHVAAAAAAASLQQRLQRRDSHSTKPPPLPAHHDHQEKSVGTTISTSQKKRAPPTAAAAGALDPSNNDKSNSNTNNTINSNSSDPNRKKRKIAAATGTSTNVAPAGTSTTTAAAVAVATAPSHPSPALQQKEPPASALPARFTPRLRTPLAIEAVAAVATAASLPSPSLQQKEPSPAASALPARFPRLKTPLAIEAATIAASFSAPGKTGNTSGETARRTTDNDNSIGIKGEESLEKWDRRYQELYDFKEKHSHLNVPPPHKDKTYMSLYWWIILQKTEWRKFNKGLKSRIDEKQVKRLILIGLGNCDGPADKSVSAPNPPLTAAWNAKFEQLCQFKREHGHVEVPEKKGGEKNAMRDLARWCNKQRKQFVNRQHKATHGTIKDKYSGTMTDLQLTKLASIGFRFTNKVLDWDTRFDSLVQYKILHGHTNVPKAYSEFSNLGDWVMGLRDRYRNSKLSPERIARLEAIGFEWRLRAVRRPNGSPRLH